MSSEHADSPRYFSLDEANRMLPLVRRIVEDIQGKWEEVEPLIASWQGLTRGERQSDAGRTVKADLDERTAALDDLVAELQELGCHFKGFREGLVDWYSLYAGRPVFLCWKRGEDAVEWWHQIDAGFTGRQPIMDTQREAFRSS